MENEHKFLQYKEKSSDKGEIRRLTAYIINRYINQNLSITKLLDLKSFNFEWLDPKKGKQKGSISFNEIFNYLIEHKTFKHDPFNLPSLESPLLDSGVDIGLPQPLLSRDGKRETAKMNLPLSLGDNFPISPKLDREGFATSNLQTYVTQNIVDLHHFLVLDSHLACQYGPRYWKTFMENTR